MKLVYQYMAIFFNFSPTSNHLDPLQVENCDSNSRLVVDEDDNGKFRLERVKIVTYPRSLKIYTYSHISPSTQSLCYLNDNDNQIIMIEMTQLLPWMDCHAWPKGSISLPYNNLDTAIVFVVGWTHPYPS